MNKKLGENPSQLTPSSTIPRIKSLIKPPPSRTSWELLLNDYLKDPNFKSNLTPNTSHSYKQATSSSPQLNSPNPIHQALFIPNLSPPYPFDNPYQTNSPLPPRRYQMTLDELVYLISQVGRSDLYREMVQYIKTQQSPTISSSHQPSNINACSPDRSTKSFFFDHKK